jgi:cobalt-precorrin-5B (C1)-methyltransferase
VDGLSLIGTSGISQPLSAEDHLEEFRQILQTKVQSQPHLVFCIGSHGIHTAKQLGIPEAAIAPTGNWIGPLLVEASLRGAKSVRLLGYQGKLIKLAGGIFNTSSHLADAKLEIISAALVRIGGPLNLVEAILTAKTADEAYQLLVREGWSDRVFSALAHTIQDKAQRYVHKYANRSLVIGTILCDRAGNIIAQATLPLKP